MSKIKAEKFNIISDVPVILTAFESMQQSKDGAGPFLQEANFYWLTGIDLPGWKCVVTDGDLYLIAPSRTDSSVIFEGSMSFEDAKAISGASRVMTAAEGVDFIKNLAKDNEVVYTLFSDPHASYYDFVINPAVEKLKSELDLIFDEVKDCRAILAKRRAIKTPQEIAKMQKAIDITASAFESAYKDLKDGLFSYEYELEAKFSYKIRSMGADGHAYEPIVASGKNALTLHYGKNNDELPKNGLVLIDIGARFNGYSADITRTYGLGEVSEREAAVHAAVLKAHNEIIGLIAPGVSLKDYQYKSDVIMKKALNNIGLLDDFSDEDTYRRYFPHAISHGLGVDVHESLGGFSEFKAGMTLTVEPGIYIPEEGIGVRIEDNILVVEGGNINLSASLSAGI